MIRYFINQEDDANKFWQVEVTDSAQTVIFGKVGTKGRETVKQFSNNAECLKETEKLIAQKVKKGYTEVKDGAAIPEKIEAPVDDSPEARFWAAIKKSNKKGIKNWKTYDIDEHLEALTKLVSKWDKQQLIDFEIVMQKSLQALFTTSIAELWIIVENRFTKKSDKIIFEDGISDDGFIYFRCWLILKGKEFFDEIRADLNAINNGKYSFDFGDTWAEGLLYITDDAYSEKHENNDESEIRDAVYEQFPEIHYDSSDRVMDKEPAAGKDLQKMYPDLVEIITTVRS